MVCVGYLFQTYGLIVERTVCTGRVAACIYQYLALFLVGDLFKYVEPVVEVVVNNYYVVVLTDRQCRTPPVQIY